MWSVEFFNLYIEHWYYNEYTSLLLLFAFIPYYDEYTVIGIGEGAFFVMKAPQNLCEAIMLQVRSSSQY